MADLIFVVGTLVAFGCFALFGSLLEKAGDDS